jgi:predicted Zn-dependent protease
MMEFFTHSSHSTGASPGPRLASRLAIGLGVASLLLTACATNPVTGRNEFNLMSEAQEVQLGQQSDPEIRREMGVYDDVALQEYVSGVGMRMAASSQRPDLPWHFTVVDSPAINAFALPGGYIYITRGILAYLDDEAELAGVLGHEIGHVTARHSAKQYSKATGASLGLALGSIFFPETRALGSAAESGLGLLFLKYGRDDELQADQLGARYAANNGWDPVGMQDMLRTLSRVDEQADRRGVPNYLATHPAPTDRVERIEQTVSTLRADAPADRFKTDRADFLRRVDGLVFGENPREGVVRGGQFLHPDLRFAVTFPDGWDIQNSKQQVVAKAPGAEIYILLDLIKQPQGSTIQEVALADMRRAGFQAVQGGETTINGLPAFMGTFEGSMQNLGRIGVRAAYVPINRTVYRVAGLTTAANFDRAQEDFTRSLRSFRELSAREAAEVRPNRIDLYTVRSGDTWQSIAQGPGKSNVPAAKLAIMNSVSVSEQPQAGDRIKIVVGG